jgi:predicted phage terminase large subunit-like protein
MAWFQTYTELTKPASFDFIFQSWDTANKSTELSNFSVCTTWGKKGNNLYLLHVYRERLDFPSLKRAVVERARLWNATTVLIEDRASGTQLIQELRHEGVYVIKSYEPPAGQDKVMRMHGACSLIENGFVFLPEKAEWLAEYLREMKVFPNGKYDDQVDSTAQALDWIKQSYLNRNVVRFFKFYPPYDLQEVDS